MDVGHTSPRIDQTTTLPLSSIQQTRVVAHGDPNWAQTGRQMSTGLGEYECRRFEDHQSTHIVQTCDQDARLKKQKHRH